jgi:hypothetical protein
MTVKVTMPNNSSDSVDFINATGTTLAQVKAYDDGSSNGHLELYTTASGTSTEQVRVTSSGNVGIGTSSPNAKLYVASAATQAIVVGQGTIGTDYGIGRDNSNGALTFYGNQTGAVSYIFSGVNGERARIDTSGNLLVGTASSINGTTCPIQGLSSANNQVMYLRNSHATAPNGIYIDYSGGAPNNTTSFFADFRDTGGQRFGMRSNGGLANYSANNANLSDERTKTDIQDAGDYLSKICAIPVRTFKYKDQTDDELNLGVIAQEVEVVAPELVDVSGFGETPEDGVPLKAIYQTDLQYALMKCIQELSAKNDALEARIAALENK